LILRPLFLAAGFELSVAPVDTDQFGTFSGDVERQGTIRETLRKKIAAARAFSGASKGPRPRYFLASEGSFGPHPLFGLLPTDLESLLLYDPKLDYEIYAEHLDEKPVHSRLTLTRADFEGPAFTARLTEFLEGVKFPSHAVMVQNGPIFKGLTSRTLVDKAISDLFLGDSAAQAQVVISSDLRAHMNPTRQSAILRAGEQLLQKLKSLCPKCQAPGFSIVRGVPGLPCQQCGTESAEARAVIWECPRCFHFEERTRPDGLTTLGPEFCEWCHP
jgi:hypothetical protein